MVSIAFCLIVVGFVLVRMFYDPVRHITGKHHTMSYAGALLVLLGMVLGTIGLARLFWEYLP